MINAPSYIFKSKHGVYYFQLRLNNSTQKQLGTQSLMYRKSLKTKNKQKALILARKLWVDINYNNKTESIMKNTKGTPSIEEQNKFISERPYKLELLAQAIELNNSYRQLLNTNPARAQLFLDDMSYHDCFALEKLGNDDYYINLDDRNHTDQIHNQPIYYPQTVISNNGNQSKLELSVLFEEFLQDRKTNNIAPKTIQAYSQQIGLFIELLNNKKACSVSREDIKYYKKMLEKIPKNRKNLAKFSKLSLKQLESLNLDKAELLSQSTKSGHVVAVKFFLKWAISNEYITNGLDSLLQGVYKERDQKHYDTFTNSDLIKLFNNKSYEQNKHQFSWQYWTPLIALFTGARLNEICQLQTNDIKKSDDIYYFDINDEGDKKLKNKNSKRSIPVHQNLIDLGFIEFVNVQKNSKQQFLFNDSKGVDKSRSVSRWFNGDKNKAGYKARCEIILSDNERKTFHSFRHTFTNSLKQLGVSEEVCAEILGHKQSITFETYSDPLIIKTKYDHIMRLNYPCIDFKKIQSWS